MALKDYRLVKTNLNNQIYDILKEMIADQRFNPGSHLNVEQLTNELGVSRTPMWEAIRRLEQEGILIHTPHKGVKLAQLTRQRALEIYLVREALECLAARLGARKATDELIQRMEECLAQQEKVVQAGDPVAYSRSDYEFHLLIYEASGVQLLKEILEALRYKTRPLAFRLAKHFPDFLEFHRRVLEAFKHGDSEAAEETIRQHHQLMVELINKSPWEGEGEQAESPPPGKVAELES